MKTGYVPARWAGYLGAWGGDERWNGIGRHVILVVEKPSELALIHQLGEKTGVRPRIGIRSRLSARGAGHWREADLVVVGVRKGSVRGGDGRSRRWWCIRLAPPRHSSSTA